VLVVPQDSSTAEIAGLDAVPVQEAA